MKDYLALVKSTETSLVTGEILYAGSDCFDFKAKDEEDLKSHLKNLEREEHNPPRSKTCYRVEKVWMVKEIKLT